MLALIYPEAVMLLEVVLVKMPIGLDIDIAALIELALTYPEAVILLEVMLVPVTTPLDNVVNTPTPAFMSENLK